MPTTKEIFEEAQFQAILQFINGYEFEPRWTRLDAILANTFIAGWIGLCIGALF